MGSSFSGPLIDWYLTHKRDLPWRKTKDPYKIWLSEIILQQTQIKQGLPYYEKFVDAFKDVHALANASEDEVLALWQGLGYYSRARNLHFTAKHVSKELNGKFPSTFKALQNLKGIGPYTAAAIASFCFNQAVPVVDGNVLRFFARFFGVQTPINTPKTHKDIFSKAKNLIDKQRPDLFNQALMEMGSLICTPKNPKCSDCVFVGGCVAYEKKLIHILPKKEKKIKKKTRYLSQVFLISDDKILIRKREQGIWKGLYEGILFEEIKKNIPPKNIIQHLGLNAHVKCEYQSEVIKHLLSHQELYLQFFFLHVSADHFKNSKEQHGLKEVYISSLDRFGFPIQTAKEIAKYLETI